MTRAEELIAQGYRRISRKYGIVSRIDREDWKDYMAEKHAPWDIEEGRKWVRTMGNYHASDHYLRCYSKDTLELGRSLGDKVPTVNDLPTEYVLKEAPNEKN